MLFAEDGIEISNIVIDRAHHIFPKYAEYEVNKTCKSVIVRFIKVLLIYLQGLGIEH